MRISDWSSNVCSSDLKEDENLAVQPQRLCNGLEIDFGLAGPGNAIEQERLKVPCPNGVDQFACRRFLGIVQFGRREIGIGDREEGIDAHLRRLQSASLDEAANNRIRYAGDHRQFAHESLTAADPFQPLRPARKRAVWGKRVAVRL